MLAKVHVGPPVSRSDGDVIVTIDYPMGAVVRKSEPHNHCVIPLRVIEGEMPIQTQLRAVESLQVSSPEFAEYVKTCPEFEFR